MIDVQKKKIQQQKIMYEHEITELAEKFKSLQRNYKALSSQTQMGQNEFVKYKKQNEELQAEVIRLKKDRNTFEAREKQFRKEIEKLVTDNRDLEA